MIDSTPSASSGDAIPEKRDAATIRRRSPLQIPTKVVEWLHRGYVVEERCQVPKAALYDAYEEFCRSEKLRPKPPNVFGKIIKQVYPHVGTSRMGSHLHQVPYYTGLAPRVHPPSGEPLRKSPPSSSPSSSPASPTLASSFAAILPSSSRSLSPPMLNSSTSVRLPRSPSPQKSPLSSSRASPILSPSSATTPTPSIHTTPNPSPLVKRQILIAPSPNGFSSSPPPRGAGIPSPMPLPMATLSLSRSPVQTHAHTSSPPPPLLPSLPGHPVSLPPPPPPPLFGSAYPQPPSPTHHSALPPPVVHMETTRTTNMTEEDRMLQSIKEKFLAYTQPTVHVK